MSLVFALGYCGIVFEEFLVYNKSGVALLMAVTLWVIRSIGVLSISSFNRNSGVPFNPVPSNEALCGSQ